MRHKYRVNYLDLKFDIWSTELHIFARFSNTVLFSQTKFDWYFVGAIFWLPAVMVMNLAPCSLPAEEIHF